jgi:hypothetical protein
MHAIHQLLDYISFDCEVSVDMYANKAIIYS